MGADSEGMNGGGQAVNTSKDAEIASNLQKALAEERGQRQALKAQLDKIETDKAAAEEAAKEAKAKEKGQYGPLYEAAKAELEKANQRLADYEAKEAERKTAAKAEADGIVAAWPEADRALMPAGLDAEAAIQFARKLDARLRTASSMPAGARSQSGSASDASPPPECVEQAKRLGKDPKEHFVTWKQTTAGRKWLAGSGPAKP